MGSPYRYSQSLKRQVVITKLGEENIALMGSCSVVNIIPGIQGLN